MKHTTLFISALFILWACVNDYEAQTRTETVSAFNIIRLKGVFTVILRNDNAYSVTITADDNVIEHIELRPSGDTMIFLNHAKGKLVNPERNNVSIEIGAPSFHTFIADDSYALRSAGTLVINDFFIWNYPEVKISEIDLDISGNYLFYWNNWLSGGKLTLRGHLENTEIRNDALHIVDAKNLHANNTTIYQYGREACEVTATTQLNYSLNGPGDIIVYGRPSEMVLLERTSSGQLIVAD